ncbi:MAG: NADH-quinone oxidoreductase subunit NuoK [Planctomycetes bacterium]|nr:NADH-quinone oxidoreductase subunit NuoK [Planctomycetota bacterium]MCH9057031.1 NADH-quinone oxidoreductase subunit NuoK [Planctomycetota bacterium]
MTIQAWMMFALVLFCIGLYGVLARRNLIGILIGIELMLNAASVNVLAVNYHVANDPAVGQIIVLFIIGLAAAEAAIALSIILAVYRQRTSIDVANLEELKG